MTSIEQIKQFETGKKMIYLASPHSHTESSVRQDRYQEALECTSWLIENGFWVFSPIVHDHNLPCNREGNINWEFWKELDSEMVKRMDEVWVLQILEATRYSKGVKAELELAKKLGKKIVSIWKNPSIIRNAIQNITLSEYNVYEVTNWEVDKILGC